ncbi:MAG: phage/plasmid primase, P4 family [Halobacteriaceae archaeon]
MTQNYAGVPAELRDRDQWLLWDGSNDTPRQPHWRGDFAISWSDPADWHSFDDAVAAADERESWGIGYVMALDNPDVPRGLYGCIDIDGGLTEDGTLQNWVPDIDRFRNANTYIERSPSGNGIHIPFVGHDIPDWWRDGQLRDHEGVDVLTNKFCTFTGDQIFDSGDAVADVDPVPWLFDAYEVIYGDPPQLEADNVDETDDYSDDFLDPADIEKALNHIDPDCPYPQWRNIGFALHSFFDGEATGKELFTDWSRQGQKYDADAERYIDAIWDSASPDAGVSIGTLLYHAKRGGWEMPTPNGGVTTQSASEMDNSTYDEISPETVKAAAGLDDDDSLGDIPVRKRASYAWEVMQENNVLIRNLEPDNELYVCEDGVWIPEGENELRKYARQALGHEFNATVVNELTEEVIATPPYSHRESFGAPSWTIAVANGLLDLEALFEDDDAALRSLEPEDTVMHQINTEYDPDAECPRFRETLHDNARAEDIPKLQEYAGYLLYHWGQPFKKAMMLVGPRDSGKSTFTRIMRELVGQDNVASESLYDLISTRWGTANLYNKMANIRNEVTPDELSYPQRFKEITGGEEQVSAEFKGEDKFEFVVTQKFLFSTNEVPTIDDADNAFYDRWLIATFPETIPPADQDSSLDEYIIENELSGVLNWALEGLERLLDQSSFTNERDLSGKREIWESYGGSIEQFKAEVIDFTGDKKDSVPKADVYAVYAAFCDYIGKETETQTKLTRELKKESGVGDKEQEGTRYYTGIELGETQIGGRDPLNETTSVQDTDGSGTLDSFSDG